MLLGPSAANVHQSRALRSGSTNFASATTCAAEMRKRCEELHLLVAVGAQGRQVGRHAADDLDQGVVPRGQGPMMPLAQGPEAGRIPRGRGCWQGEQSIAI